jgi:hypothetical protein
MPKINKVVRIGLSGGLIGLLLTNPRAALEQRILKENAEGWHVTQVIAHSDTNLAAIILKLVVLVLTLFLWTWGAGYLVVLERER